MAALREPAPAGQEGGQHVALEARSRAVLQQRPPAVGGHERHEFDGGGLDVARRFRRLVEQEPVEAVRAERDEVGALTERFAGRMKLNEPRPNILFDLRTDISRLVQLSSEARLRDCASTLTAS